MIDGRVGFARERGGTSSHGRIESACGDDRARGGVGCADHPCRARYGGGPAFVKWANIARQFLGEPVLTNRFELVTLRQQRTGLTSIDAVGAIPKSRAGERPASGLTKVDT